MKTQTVLVTGGSGFVGIHSLFQLLGQGYKVHTTLRSIAKNETIMKILQDGGITNVSDLSFYEADLTADKGWNEALEGVDYVLHVASPFPLVEPEDENELIIPAREGALRVLAAAKKAGVKRVVLTSSFAAIGYGVDRSNHVFTEADWTNVNAPLTPYLKSKTLAELAAWDFMKREGGNMELAVVNPVGIFGPILGGIVPASFTGAIQSIVDGTVKETPAFSFGAVDVRDVVDLHIRAMLHPEANGQRFIATADGVISFYDIAALIKKERPGLATKIANLEPLASELYAPIANQKAKEILGWKPRTKEEAILASVDTGINE